MKIVYSYWGDVDNPINWLNKKFMITSLIISVIESHRLYGRVEMVTDSINKKWIEKLGLPFESIKTDLDCLDKYDRESWSLGKIKAYQIQTEPFMHVDIDVIMYNKFSENFFSNDIGVQNFESFEDRERFDYYEKYIEAIEKYVPENELPIGFASKKRSVNMGVYYCKNLDFNKIYCEEVFKFIGNNIETLKDKVSLNRLCLTWEQYFCICIADELGLSVSQIIDENGRDVYEGGYRHLLSLKSDPKVAENFNTVIERSYPDYVDKLI